MASLCTALVGFGAWRIMDARDGQDTRKRKPPTERVHVVNVQQLAPATVTPTMLAYGEVQSWRTLEIRAPASGRLVDVSEQFRDGATVARNAPLFVIDPADPQARRNDAQAGVAEADAEVEEAAEAVLAAEQELKAAERQKRLRGQSLRRQRGLLAKGYATAADIEAAELSFASAEQAVLNRAQTAIAARKRVERAELKLQRAKLTLGDAERDVGETRVRAPFSGSLTAVEAVLGRLVSINEKLAELVDPSALEVAFRVSNRQFSRLLDPQGNIAPLSLTVGLRLGDRTLEVTGVLDRADAVVGEGQSGRLMFARLQAAPGTVLRPGDFVSVNIVESAVVNVATIPATAATEDGRVLLVGDAGRLVEKQARILRRQGDQLLVSDVPFGQQVVLERLPQLGSGVRVRVVEPTTTVAAAEQPADDKNMELEPARRQMLVKAITQAKRISPERREWILGMLNRPRVPRKLVERIESRIAQARGS